MLRHILKLLRNLNMCDNVGESKAANEQEQKRKKALQICHNSINFTFSTAL